MEVSLPFNCEYAKSSRGKCKGCKTTIEKDILRLAVMVQSGFHDGKQANWFHFECFFKKQRPKTIGDFANIEKLRYEDQEEIRKSVESTSSIILPSSKQESKGKGKKRSNQAASGLDDYGIEYASTSRSECRGCKQKIIKGIVRVKKVAYDTEIGMKYGGQPLWHHLECFAEIRTDFGYYESGVKLPGFDNLTREDQEKVKKVLPVKEYDVPDSKKFKAEPKDETDLAQEATEEKLIIKQNKELFKHRDNLKGLDIKKVVSILELNNQQAPMGTENILDSTADLLTFGALLKCEKCSGQFELTKGGYICRGDLNEWVKCMNLVKEPPRIPCKIPDDLRENYPFLKKYKSKVTNRAIKYVPPSVPLKKVKKEEGEEEGPRVKREKPKLYKMEFVIIGKTKITKDELKSIITSMGGKLVTKIQSHTAAIISNHDEVKKMNMKMTEAKNFGIHVIEDTYFDEIQNGDPFELLNSKRISVWGTDPKIRISQEDETKEKESMYTRNVPSKVTITIKAGSAVDPDSKLDHMAHIYESRGVKYNATLACTDIQTGKNSYYKIQVIQSDTSRRFWVFRSWGRIGTNIGKTKLTEFDNANSATADFIEVWNEKTLNKFKDRENFVKRPGAYVPIEVDYSDEKTKNLAEKHNVKSKLEQPVQNLIKLLFDIDMMKKTLLAFELDTAKMPLGKLSKKQMESAYKVLTELSNLITNSGSESQFIALSNQFYTLIPHSCGIELPPVLDKVEMIKNKIEMLDSMMEIELAYSLLNTKVDESINPIDAHYQQLNTEMETLDHKSEEFKLLVKYVKTTHAETHKMYDLEILDVFKVKRKGEERRYKPFKKLHNRKLLWHGSRLTNYVGILSHGLKIAPPEAPSTGYMFGKGIYFADMVSKSANYCYTNSYDTTGLMLLCEVALGDMYECKQAKYVTKLPNNTHSTKGVGQTWPDPSGSIIRSDGVEIPCGKPKTDRNVGSSLLYNEFIVYDVAQVNVQYLLKMNFKYKS